VEEREGKVKRTPDHVAQSRVTGVFPGRQAGKVNILLPLRQLLSQRSSSLTARGLVLSHGHRLYLTPNSTAYRVMGSLLFLHRGTRHRWGEGAYEWPHHRVCFSINLRPGSYTTRMLYLGVLI
jgi:hypothetical protein